MSDISPRAPLTSDSVPPIVLLADDDRETLDMYSLAMEGAGLWVAAATTVAEAIEMVQELEPNAVITDIGFADGASGVGLVHALKQEPATGDVPVIVVTGRPPDTLPVETRREADLVLVKPVLPHVLVARIRELIAHARDLRRHSNAMLQRTGALVRKSARLMEHARRIQQWLDITTRPCPSCGVALEWTERATVGAVEYDYYRWCRNGCGLFCFKRQARPGHNWVKLA